jgi:hypothetical protein
VAVGCLGMALIIFAKRLLTNHIGLPADQDWRDVLLNRLVFDRDLRDRDEWVRRMPGGRP